MIVSTPGLLMPLLLADCRPMRQDMSRERARLVLQQPAEPISEETIAEAIFLYASRYMSPYRSRMGQDWEDALSELVASVYTLRMSGRAIRDPEHFFAKASSNAFIKWSQGRKRLPIPTEDMSQVIRAIQVATDEVAIKNLGAAALLKTVYDLLTVKELRAWLHVDVMAWPIADYANKTDTPHSTVSSQLASARRKIAKQWPQSKVVT